MKHRLRHGINKDTKTVMFVFMLAALLLFSPCIASAYTVEIKNTTSGTVAVDLYTSGFFVEKHFGLAQIEPGQSYTFHTSAKCPSSLTGIARTSAGWWIELPNMGCAGLSEGNRAGGICCWDSKWQVIYQSGLYHFKKI
jgi:hypothetical protein